MCLETECRWLFDLSARQLRGGSSSAVRAEVGAAIASMVSGRWTRLRRHVPAGWCRPWFGPRSARSRVVERVFCSLSAAPARRHQQWRESPSPTRLVGPRREALYTGYPQAYVEYYTASRTHLALEKDAPRPRPVAPPTAGRVVAIRQVGGLHAAPMEFPAGTGRARAQLDLPWPPGPAVVGVVCALAGWRDFRCSSISSHGTPSLYHFGMAFPCR